MSIDRDMDRLIAGAAEGGWDSVENGQEEVVGDSCLRLVDPYPPAMYDCPIHGHTESTFTFHVDGSETVFCATCIRDAMLGRFQPLERVENDNELEETFNGQN